MDHHTPESHLSTATNANAVAVKAPRQPLAGMRVIDLTQVMAGPYCSMLLADMGAEVIKVEPPGTGDQTRAAMGFKLKGNDSLGFLNLNRNKRSITLNLKTEAGREVLLRLIKDADVLLENFRPGVMKRLGLDYETLSQLNPQLIYASISGFGQTGPLSTRPGYDLIAQAMSGVMSVTGYTGGLPVKAGVPVGDIGCALFTTYAVLSAYIGKQTGGTGQYIDASLMDAAMAFSVWDISEYWGTGTIPGPLGTANRMSAPYQAVQASDGYFVMGATNNKLWTLLCQIMGRTELLEDERFKDISSRLANREVLIEELEKTFVTRTREAWTATLLNAGIPAGPMQTYPEAFQSEHAVHRQMRIDIEHPVEGKIPNIGFAVKLSGTPGKVRLPPPLLGEHTHDILAEIGIAGNDLQRLTDAGAFAL
jgi:crotonobetainyl-CoA:carnitine CoA-transferase CaiB-like acyl-CoA transferase